MPAPGLFCPQCQVFRAGDAVSPGQLPSCPVCAAVLCPAPVLTGSERRWYCSRGGRTAGPYSLTELKLLAAVGDLRPTDTVWPDEGGQPAATTARALLTTAGPAHQRKALPVPVAAQPVPPWAAEESMKDTQFIRFSEPTLAEAAPPVAGPPRRTFNPWVALLIVGSLVAALMGLRAYFEGRQSVRDDAAPAETGSAKAAKDGGNAKPAVKRDAAARDKGAAAAAAVLLRRQAAEAAARGAAAGKLAAPAAAAQAKAPALAQVSCSAGWATFGQVLPAGAARDGLRLGDLATQTDVKTRWPDGSIRFAVVTARVPRTGTYALTAGPASADVFTPEAPPTAWAAFAVGSEGTEEYTSFSPNEAGKDAWLRGPLVYEFRHVAELKNEKTGKKHPFLRVIFDVRAYQDGQGRVDVTVENVRDVRGATAVEYSVWLAETTGKHEFHKAGLTHPYLTRWRHVLPVGLKASQVSPDFEPAYRARALPRYLALVEAQVNAAAGEKFEPLGPGDLNPEMHAHGGRPELAPYPDWTARYLVHKDPRQLRYVLAHGDLAGSWPVHVRKDDGAFRSIDEHPNYWLDARAEPRNRPLGDLAGCGPLQPDVAHQPSLAYVPYLLTGDRYYADEMAFWANYVLLATFQDRQYNQRGGSAGLLYGQEVRGVAWGLRNLADAAAYLPDDHPLRAYFAQKVENNLRWLDKYADDHPAPLGTMWHDKRPENQEMPPKTWIALWEQNYLAWAIDHANKQGFKGGLKHRDRIARFQLGLFTHHPQYRREFAAPYILAIGERDKAGRLACYNTMAELFQKNYPDKNTPPMAFAGFYGVDARLMLLIGLENGWLGAKEAYNFLWPKLAVEPHTDGVPDLARRAGWAIAPEAAPTKSGRR